MNGLDSYRDHASKDEWRRWQWDMIARYCPVPTPQATVLYLAGPDDLDRREARRRGFLPENLIAVDVNGDNVRAIRARRGLAIRAPLDKLLLAWPRDWPIHGISADLCCGLDRPVVSLVASLLLPTARLRRAVCVINMQRGRDAFSNKGRRRVQQTHRGAALLAVLYELCPGADTAIPRCFQPQHFSYRSRQVTMDSVAFAIPGYVSDDFEIDKAIARRVAALRAVRTVRAQQWGRPLDDKQRRAS